MSPFMAYLNLWVFADFQRDGIHLQSSHSTSPCGTMMICTENLPLKVRYK